MTPAASAAERRVLLLAPTPRDTGLTLKVLRDLRIDGMACETLSGLESELDAGCGAVVLAEEALGGGGTSRLARWMRQQPPWSDLPVLLVARPGADSLTLLEAVDVLPNVTVLERPTRVSALVSAVRTALRARKRQYDLRQQLERLRDADQHKNEFLAILAHELRNPLAPIRNALGILRHAGPQVDRAALHQVMERQVDTMVRLVDDLLEASRISRGLIELRKEPVDLGRIVRQAIETSQPLVTAARHRLEVELPAEPVRVYGDPVRLAQVFCNLLNNAAKYTPDGGVVGIRLAVHGGRALVSVRDSGIGISAEMLPRVFELFMQVRDARHAAQGGLGIGLTLVKSLVERHGGTVEVRSEGVGRGSAFDVRLPIAEAGTAVPASSDATPLEHPALKDRTVLIVDDNRDAADSLGLYLELLGMRVRVAYAGAQGLSLIDEARPDFAIVDIGMARMDGLEFAQRVRERIPMRGPVLVALTGWGQDADRERSRQAGFDHHLVKPVDMALLLQVLSTAEPADGDGR